MMAKRLQDSGAEIAVFISSPAKRAKKTCKAFVEVFNREKEEIVFVDELYHASVETFFNTVAAIDDRFDSAAIFSHNPGITDFVNALNTGASIDNMPTCAVFAVGIEAGSWADFADAPKKFISFDFPKSVDE